MDNTTLPQSIDAEIGVLGALLVEDEVAGEIIQILNKSHFLIPAHQIIYEILALLYDTNRPLDPVLVQEELKQRGQLQNVGGEAYLLSLIEAVPSAGNAEYYASIVREKSVLRQLINAAHEISYMAKKGENTIDSLLDKSEQLIFEITQNETSNEPAHIYGLLLSLFRQLESETGSTQVTPTGFPDLDNLMSGLQGSTLNILAARPSMGKTSFALNIADNIGIKQNRGVLIFSLEMSKEQLAQNMVCSRVQLSPHKLKGGSIDHEDYVRLTTQAGVFAQAPIYIDDTPGISIREVRAKARRFKSRHDIGLIIIDYLQLMSGSGGDKGSDSRQQEISQISRSLKEIARELKIPLIALSQLNRAVDARDDHRPRMSDLRESGALEQDADIIIFLYRDEYYNKESAEPGIAEVIIAKNRTGPTGSVKLRFIKEFMQFLSLSYQRQ